MLNHPAPAPACACPCRLPEANHAHHRPDRRRRTPSGPVPEGPTAQAWPELQVLAVAHNGVEAARLIADTEPDIAFLDIQMPGLTGLEVAQGIEGRTRVVFVTAWRRVRHPGLRGRGG